MRVLCAGHGNALIVYKFWSFCLFIYSFSCITSWMEEREKNWMPSKLVVELGPDSVWMIFPFFFAHLRNLEPWKNRLYLLSTFSDSRNQQKNFGNTGPTLLMWVAKNCGVLSRNANFWKLCDLYRLGGSAGSSAGWKKMQAKKHEISPPRANAITIPKLGRHYEYCRSTEMNKINIINDEDWISTARAR